MPAIVATFVRLRWRLLRGAIRHGGTERVGVIVSTVASALIGLGTGTAVFVTGRSVDQREQFAVILCALVLLAVVGFGIVAGISQPVDPRVIAAEPLGSGERATGLLAAAAFGPPGLAGIALGLGLAGGMARELASFPIVAIAVVSWLLSLLLIARTATNLLAMLTSRFPRAGQLLVGVAGLIFYGLFQFVPALLHGLDDDGRRRLAGALAKTPPGQIGRALSGAEHAWLHLAIGSVWVPALVVAFAWSTRELAIAVRRAGGLDTSDAEAGRVGRLARRLCGGGAVGALAWRGMLTRFRTPRTALETFTGAGVGMAAVLVPTVVRDGAGSGAVLVGGAVQLAVLFMSGNSFGSDGPAVTHELLTGVDLRTLVRGKARSIAIVAAPLAVIGPIVAATITGEWRFIVAGFGVGVGGLLAGTGAAVVQSAMVPIAIPESDNPFAGGDSGKGLLAALLLGVVLAGLAVVTVPVALLLLWATDRGQVGLVTVSGALTVMAGWGVLRAGIAIATRRLSGREPEFVASVTPAR
jgi:ABC-2 type transport system permease protein